MKKSFFVNQLLDWYDVHKRDLPWRKEQNPYFIWLSEVLLQQTRVQQGLPYYERFIQAFPTVHALAEAEEKQVLRMWEGLGYYSRARNMHEAAKHISLNLKGVMPSSYADLIQLKGIGNYTAAAIASFAFGENVAVLDGNVYRVLARVFGIHTDIASTAGNKEFTALAKQLLPQKKSADYNQAIMEFGALHCTPALPKCESCPLIQICLAYKNNWQKLLPVKIQKIKKKVRFFNYNVFRYQENYLLKPRSKDDIWEGMYDFHLSESSALLSAKEIRQRLPESARETTSKLISKDYKHLLTHQTIFARFHVFEFSEERKFQKTAQELGLLPFSHAGIAELPKPVLISKFLGDYLFP